MPQRRPQDADAIVVRSATKVTAALIAAAPKLRVIARAGNPVVRRAKVVPPSRERAQKAVAMSWLQ